ncbi:MAG: hypothetical protein GY851_29340 [bacterium]|nr:hypothetical protein [bacterium]
MANGQRTWGWRLAAWGAGAFTAIAALGAAALFLVPGVIGVRAGGLGEDADGAHWRHVRPGLSIAEFVPDQRSRLEDSRITIVRIDSEHFDFKLLCASEHDGVRMTARDWCREHDLVCAINAGMYLEDGHHIAYMKNFDHVDSDRLSDDNAVVAFNRIDVSVPEFQIIDREHQDFDELRKH